MKNKMVKLGLGCAFLALMGCGDNKATSGDNVPVVVPHVETKAERLVRQMGPGMNLGNGMEADPTEGSWGVTLEESYFQLIADSGFKNVRIPVRWNTHLRTDGTCFADSVWMERVKWAVRQANNHGLIAVVDQHHRADLYADPSGMESCFLETWKDMATNLKEFSTDSLILEVLNEPQGELDNAALWNPMQQKAIDVIRAIDPERTLMVGGVSWNSWRAISGLQLRAQDTNIIATFHYYDPYEFTHQGADFVDPVLPTGVTWSATPAQMRSVREAFDNVQDWSKANSVPIYMGEFGSYNMADTTSREIWTEYMATQATAHGFAWAYWEFCSGFGVYDAASQVWNSFLMRALLHPTHGFSIAARPDLDSLGGFVFDDFDSYKAKNITVNMLSGALTELAKKPLDSASGRWYAFHSPESNIMVDGQVLMTPNRIQYDSLTVEPELFKLISDSGYDGRALHAKMILKGDAYPWVGIGTSLNGTQLFDLSKLQALSFWAKGYGTFKVGWNTAFEDSCCSNDWGKFSKEITLSKDWKRYVIWADDFAPSPYSALADAGYEWVDHRNDVRELQILAGQGYGEVVNDSLEIWLDNVMFHGMGNKDLGL